MAGGESGQNEQDLGAQPLYETLRERLWRIVFLSDTRAGRTFDIILLVLIITCTIIVVLESVDRIRLHYARELFIVEWVFTMVFTVEYALRVWLVRNRWKYIFSFFGIVDLIAILPSYLELLFVGVVGPHYLMTIRFLRLLRMFRVLKLGEYLGEASILMNALRSSRRKILVFFYCIMVIICVEGTLMYVIEHDYNENFSNIPQSIYWAIVTLTTVGYGDVVPVTILGKLLASALMLTGYAIIAVPTGVVTAEIGREISRSYLDNRTCKECGWARHDHRAQFCHQCGTRL
jgi:voltage-gated potassium channel